MGEGDCDFREKKVVEEGPEFAGDETVVDDFVGEHQVFDEMPVRVRQFYSVKLLPLENPNTDAKIKKAEEKIEKMNRSQILIAQKLRERVKDRSKLSWVNYYDDSEFTLKWRERLNILHLSLDKLTFANNAYKGEPINSCLSGGEVDKQKLSFLMVHGCKNMADEKRLLREVNASQGKDGGMTVEELHDPRLQKQMCFNNWRYKKTDDDVARKQAILKDIKQHEIARERAIADAVVNGKLWNSLGSKKAIQAEALNNSSGEQREKQVKGKAKIRKVEKNISSLEKRLKDTNRKKGYAYNTILKLKKQNGGENVEVLAKKKGIAAVLEVSQVQVEKFMQQWLMKDVKDPFELLF